MKNNYKSEYMHYLDRYNAHVVNGQYMGRDVERMAFDEFVVTGKTLEANWVTVQKESLNAGLFELGGPVEKGKELEIQIIL